MLEQESTLANTQYFRTGTKLSVKSINILFNAGGLGDFICRIPAVRKLCIENPHINVKLWVPEYFQDLAANFLSDVKCYISLSPLFKDRYERGEPVFDFESRLVRPLGINLMAHAHELLLSESPDAQDLQYPRFKTGVTNIKKFSYPNSGFVVITTAATSPTRALKGESIEGIVDYVKSKGLSVMFLGKNELADKYKALFPREVDYSRGLDYRNQTSITEVAELISKSKAVVGLDNGLLHLACCTDTPVVFGFTTVRPEHRICGRESGQIYKVEQPKELECRYCQSNMKMLFDHDFRNCLYRDFKCRETLTPELFIEQLDKIL